ncbi:MAG: hypothetical protein A2Y67_03525 [Candidatus Buchananbacteria bacterium RBG_13_39_9]|uniref:DUF192 domain-containing protein n=1 Tax=Candidatus Buchananbacteria bacterium RBG_13_39_9 TaxID=1797531 RepID=A0A1G1XS77_9BACT|nr:MAG: hypothetical protein A2Y67_03525 [Candidatus Buchananbacteria bacterium RBG_13_39_9]
MKLSLKNNLPLAILVIIAAVLVLGALIYLIYQVGLGQGLHKGKVSIRGTSISVEVAQTPEQLAKGLSGRSGLGANNGMLFAFKDSRYRNFWMNDLKFPLDIIWIADDTIIGIEANVPAPLKDQQNLPIYKSPSEANYVLEVNAGFAEKHNFNVGDNIQIDIK